MIDAFCTESHGVAYSEHGNGQAVRVEGCSRPWHASGLCGLLATPWIELKLRIEIHVLNRAFVELRIFCRLNSGVMRER